jgi:hypothetical protein
MKLYDLERNVSTLRRCFFVINSLSASELFFFPPARGENFGGGKKVRRKLFPAASQELSTEA